MRLLTRVLGGRETLAASLLTTAWILIVALPLVWLGFNLADHIRDATAFVRDVQVDGLPDAPAWLGAYRSLVSAWSVGGSRSTSRGGPAGVGQTVPRAGGQLVAGAQCADRQRCAGTDP